VEFYYIYKNLPKSARKNRYNDWKSFFILNPVGKNILCCIYDKTLWNDGNSFDLNDPVQLEKFAGIIAGKIQSIYSTGN